MRWNHELRDVRWRGASFEPRIAKAEEEEEKQDEEERDGSWESYPGNP